MNVLQYNKQKNHIDLRRPVREFPLIIPLVCSFLPRVDQSLYTCAVITHTVHNAMSEADLCSLKLCPQAWGEIIIVFFHVSVRVAVVSFFSLFSRPSRPTHGRFGANSERG